jgi:hypothetical protein
MAISGIAALIFMSLPFVVVPLRKKAGFATHQWDSDPATSHVRFLRSRREARGGRGGVRGDGSRGAWGRGR